MVERCLRDAIDAAPNWFKPHWLLAQVLARTNRQNEAILEARRSSRNATGARTPKSLKHFAFWNGDDEKCAQDVGTFSTVRRDRPESVRCA